MRSRICEKPNHLFRAAAIAVAMVFAALGPGPVLAQFQSTSASLQRSTVAGTSTLSLRSGSILRQTGAAISDESLTVVPGSPTRVVTWTERAAPTAPKRHWYAASLDGVTFSEAREQQVEILLKQARFDPAAEPPPGPALRQANAGPADARLRIVQFITPPLEPYRRALAEAGASAPIYLPSNAYIVRLSDQGAQAVSQLPFVRWVGAYLPAYKADPALLERPVATVNIQVVERGPGQKAAVAATINLLGGKVDDAGPEGFLLRATLSGDQLRSVLEMDEVLWADAWGPGGSDMNVARQATGASFIQTTLGFTGQGVRGEVMDDNILSTHVDFQGPAPLFHGSHAGATDHGTPCYGIVFGKGVGNPLARGMLPDAEQGIFGDKDPILANYSLRYTHTAELVNPAGSYRAVFQSNSWGSTWSTDYTTISAQMDDILFLNNIVLTQSMSNNGSQLARPEAWAKNIIALGGIQHNDTATRADDSWWPFASIGPAADGRVKPDLSHFADEILTTFDANNSSYLGGFNGTSAATAITAGSVGLVMQMWKEQVFPGFGNSGSTVFAVRPRSTTAKALLINSAYQYSFSGAGHDLTRTHQGWGTADLENLYNLRNQTLIVNGTEVLAPLASKRYTVNVTAGTTLRATMVFLDPMGNPAASVARINDLSLKLTSPTGVVYWGNNGLGAGNWSTSGGSRNTVDTVENVFLQSAEGGNWFVDVFADEVVADAYTDTPAVDANFSLVVSGVNACTSAAFTTQPANLTRCTGISATFTVVATGSPAPTLQWRKNGTNIGGATSASYTISSPAAGDAATYDCVATNTCGPTTSSPATLTVNTAPAITTQPSAASACTGGSAAFTVAGSGSPAPTFQWRKNSVNIGGATSATLNLSGIVAGDAANYDCVVTNTCGSVTSSAVALTVNTAPAVTTQPTSLTRCPGISATFTVAASGSPAPTFQWRKNSVNIGGATSASYTIAAPGPADAANYDCVVTNSCGSATSSAATLTMNAAPAVTTQPTSLTRCPGISATFTVAASGAPAPTFQWRKDTVNIAGATSASYTIASPVAADAASYDCVVTNTCGSATSSAATLTMNAAPAVTTQPTSLTRCPGVSATFTVTVSGTPTPTFQWRKNTVNIGGATSASYTIASPVAGDAASYDCVVTNSCGSATSSAATLTMNVGVAITTQPTNQAACTGGGASFTVAATGTPTPTFQWRKAGVNIGGATSATLNLSAIVAGDAASYDCVLTNTCGSVTSSAATLTVNSAPAVTTQPTNQSACPGSSASFTVTASGSPAPTYQWRKGGANIGGATSATLSLTGIVAGDAANYDCVVTNTCGSATSSAATLTVNSAPAITTQPSPASACTGGAASFTVAASGVPAPTYQWRKSGVTIGGSTSATLNLSSIIAADAANYDCVVTNACGSVTSSAVALTVNTAPAITTQPISLTRCPGVSATFSVAASGSPAPTFQWRKNTVNIGGATSASFTIASPAAADAASYDCVVTNACGAATSSAATLTMNAPPAITTQPTSQSACPGGSISFTVAASGSPAPAFQWRKGGVNIGGATAVTLNLTNIVAGDAASYDCVVTNTCSSATSSAATLTVNTSPSVTTQPTSQSACPGGSASFTVAASGSPAPTFQWRKGGVNISGATSATLNLTSLVAGDAASYDCVVTNTCGSATSSAATLTLHTTPAVTTQPTSLTRCPGTSATFTVAASGSPAPTFQWRKNTSNIAAATSASYTIASPTAADAASYDCVVTNTCGSATSSAATLTVNAAPAVTTQPTNQSACPGGSASFTVAASGTPAPTFQWRKGGVNIAGATTATLNLTGIVAGDAASYDCVLTNTCGSTTSSAATLTVNAGPAVTTQPTNQAACPGGSASFTVAASGSPAPTFQWRKGGVNIAGAITATLTLTSIVAGDAATYDCIITNTCGSATSSTATLTVNAQPAITTQPGSLTRCSGVSATFTVAASGSPVPTFQWRKGGVTIAGATSASYTIASPTAADAASYDCVVTNTCGSATSSAATLTVNSGPGFSTQPSNQSACTGGSAAFTVAATGSPTPTFQWRKNTTNIPGATTATLSLTTVVPGDAASYDCVLTNTCGSATSSAATLTVNTGPAVTTQPTSQSACTGGTASFTVAASGSPAPTFQWRKNTTNVAGATSAALALTSLVAGDAASYDCVITNSCGSTTSSAATLTINTAPAISTQPTSLTRCTGISATFTVAASGSPAPTFQWRRDGVTIVGATSASFTIAAPTTADAAAYDCLVTNTCTSITSSSATLTVNTAPAITTQPTNQASCPAGSASFTVAATGTPSPTFQWRKNAANIPGATAATLNLTGIVAGDAASYDCVLTNTCGSATTSAAALTVSAGPIVTTQPSSQSACPGGTAVFTVVASGSPAPTYQWRKNTTTIAGATSATLSLTGLAAGDAASYDCVVTNTCGSTTSSAATLTLNTAPAITTQPLTQSACTGGSVSLTAAASGSPAPTFQWRQNTVTIPGATSATLTLNPVIAGDAASYDCIATNSCGSATTSAAVLTVNAGPAFSTQPSSRTDCSGTSASFTVAVTGTPAPTLQWRKNGTSIPGATSATLTINPVAPADAATYDCIATNTCGPITSSGATLTVTTAPAVTTQPIGSSACAGGSASFTVAASGSPAPTYQWRKNAVNIAGATSAILTLNTVTAGDAASYDCVVTNPCGIATSSAATLTVNTTPSITSHPSNQTVCTDAGAVFTVAASASPAPTFQWRKNAVNIAGATAASFSIPAALASDAAAYDCVVTNACGSATSSAATLTVNSAPSITTQPSEQAVCSGASASFTIATSGSPSPTFQWRKNSVNIPGATSPTLTINPGTPADAATYDCVATNACGAATSSTATLTVNTAPGVAAQPANQSACPGSPASFTVAASGSPAPTFQWRKNGSNIPGATAATLALPSASAGDTASYDCVLTNTCGTATSDAATLTLLASPTITTQPANQSACPGGSVSFSVAAAGPGTLLYQWQRNGVNIPGATSATLTLNTVSGGDVAAYAAVVTNACGSATSLAATLTIGDAPTISTQPQPLTLNAGTSASFTVAAGGSPPLTYQWRRNGINLVNGGAISGATSATLTINPARLIHQAAYDVIVSSNCGPVTSNPATLTVLCRADWNGDLAITPADVAGFVSAWSLSLAQPDLVADYDGSGAVNPADVAAYVSDWFAALSGGC